MNSIYDLDELAVLKDKLQSWPGEMALTSEDIRDLLARLRDYQKQQDAKAWDANLAGRLKNYLDFAIGRWRKKRQEGDPLAICYVDAFQSVHVSIFGIQVPMDAEDAKAGEDEAVKLTGGLATAPVAPSPGSKPTAEDERREGHKALRYDKDTRTIKTFDPNPPTPITSMSEEDNKAFADLWTLLKWAMKQGGDYFINMTHAAFKAQLHLRRRLSAPAKPRVSRKQIRKWAIYISNHAPTTGETSIMEGVLSLVFREAGVKVEEEK